ncbi:UVR8 [Scenedesmus sp. PABB004]|nr:UVR8 [Scenedesmus sp. PABB004]
MLPLAACTAAGGRAGPLRAAAALAAAAASGGDRARSVHVLAWGRNAELQCAVEGGLPIVARPTPVLELHGLPVLGLAAGPLSSAAVAGAAGAWTWGDGTAGALGHGSAGRVAAPCRVEALAGGRAAALRGVSLGHSHALFVDAAGALWACGEGKEGQLGLSQPLQELAAQHRRAWAEAQLPGGARRSGAERAAQLLRAAAPEPAGHVAQGWGSLGGPGGGGQARQQLAAALQSSGGSAARRGWPSASGLGGGLFGGGSGTDLGISLGAWGGGADLEAHLHGVGLQPGQYGTPARVGGGSCASLLGLGARGGGGGASAAAAEGEEAGLGAEVVVDAAAGKFFSVAATAKGEVWTFGADFNGALGGGDASWLSSPRRVAAPIAAALAADGGAVAVAAGGTFAAARTAAGSVLVWGRLGPASRSAAPFARVALPRGVAVRGMAAGQQHLLMTDGARVWAVGRWLDASGDEAGAACASAPRELLALPGGAGVARVAAGAHASAVVTDDGGLWLWGRLLDEQHGHGLLRRAGGAAASAGAPAPVDWRWAGFGGAAPRRVEALGAVRDVALGGWHALVLTD